MTEYSIFGRSESGGEQYRGRNTYGDDVLIQSDRFEKDGIIYSNGTILRKGNYDFGIVKIPEEIRITLGEIVINGTIYKEGETMDLEKGDNNMWNFDGPATYLCKFI